MASQIETLRAQFDGMNTAQKKQFIQNLKNALENKNNAEHKAFLNECIKKYNSEVQTKTSNTASKGASQISGTGKDATIKTTSQLSASGKDAASKAAFQISTASKKATGKLAPMASAARDAGKDAFNKAAGSSVVDKVAHNETISKIVDSEVMSKVSKNKNKRVLAIAGALAVVVLVIVIASVSGNGGSSSGGHNTSITQGTASQYVIDNIQSAKGFRSVNVQDATTTAAGKNLSKNGESVFYATFTDANLDVHTFFVTASGIIYDASNSANPRKLFP